MLRGCVVTEPRDGASRSVRARSGLRSGYSAFVNEPDGSTHNSWSFSDVAGCEWLVVPLADAVGCERLIVSLADAAGCGWLVGVPC